jgi:hypothetical protein
MLPTTPTYANLLIAFEAARQAGRGLYRPDDTLAPALAALLAEGSGDRGPFKTLWHCCRRQGPDGAGTVDSNHRRGLAAMQAWREIAADVGVVIDAPLLAQFYAASRVPAQRWMEWKSAALWEP